jgi:hypothetical protein
MFSLYFRFLSLKLCLIYYFPKYLPFFWGFYFRNLLLEKGNNKKQVKRGLNCSGKLLFGGNRAFLPGNFGQAAVEVFRDHTNAMSENPDNHPQFAGTSA